ncbi:hypothetical protein DAPPUDRAFT_234884 [Daphnia pulex]|uniref:Uncharacterized protein n=1 Tax=Daphnia pulex TaxID=6669 RepID=E9FXP4_DAPPU|nr:hypothetical protein DAPPUDRAFT_234884 [Daphnia pulex]|eukprot:EFX88129.1 hypothetical protein DAPPUDRAFT_234884 [Daphnia pulex]
MGRVGDNMKRPIPSNVNLQKERPVCMSFLRARRSRTRGLLHPSPATSTCRRKGQQFALSLTLEGHGDHYEKRVMQWCKRLGRRAALLLLVAVSLTARSTTGVLMSPAHGGYQTTTSPSYYTNNIRNDRYYTEAPKYSSSSPSYTTKAPELHDYPTTPAYYTDSPAKLTTKTVEYYTEAPKYDRNQLNEHLRHPTRQQLRRINHGVVLLLCVASLMAGSTTGVSMPSGCGGYQATTPPSPYNTTKSTYATSTYYAEALKLKSCVKDYSARIYISKAADYYTTDAPKYYNTKYAAPVYYTKAPNTLPRATQHNTTEAAKYSVAQTYKTATARSYYVEQKYYTEASVYYTTIYATPRYYDEAPNYYTEEATNYQTEALLYYTKATEYYATTKCYYFNYGVVLLLVVSLMVGSTTGVPIFRGYGEYQTEPECYTIAYAAPAFYTEVPKYYSVPSYYTEAPAYYATKAVEYYTEALEYYSAPITAQRLLIRTTLDRNTTLEDPVYYTTTYASTRVLHRSPQILQRKEVVYYTTTHAALSFYTEASKYYITKAPECYTTTFVASSYYPEVPKYYTTEAPEYYTTTYPVPTYTEAPKNSTAPSYYTIKAPGYYITTYASPVNYREVLKY